MVEFVLMKMLVVPFLAKMLLTPNNRRKDVVSENTSVPPSALQEKTWAGPSLSLFFEQEIRNSVDRSKMVTKRLVFKFPFFLNVELKSGITNYN